MGRPLRTPECIISYQVALSRADIHATAECPDDLSTYLPAHVTVPYQQS